MLNESNVLTLDEMCPGLDWMEKLDTKRVQSTVDDFRGRMQAKADFERNEAMAIVKKLVELEGGLTHHLMCKANRIFCTYAYRCKQINWLTC